jgi:hypothetical protein
MQTYRRTKLWAFGQAKAWIQNIQSKQPIQSTRLTQNKHLSQAQTNYTFSSKQMLAKVTNVAWAQNLDISTVVTCSNHN